ncbi:putative photosynthetic complex assembly protein [Rhodovastum atsumiense]|uniref:PH domain-containing protein n=1 Tax=Rhodovastum atsumiense TaxID=504468 RepID=A0A5M6IXB4_9PROT|nr:photosynthetic complex putative assembly protein PuhB [Rhodovastum atsumiense]KAA5612901.1 PH domain-containing protein [Rhodovastum atsumiense]CAH2601017.1 putative photosynthetic complex assembly protein [Rhodovastum atsumiense]
MNEQEDKPVRGLPERLPDGEKILWQGAPRWGALARWGFHVRKIALYFALLLTWQVASNINDGVPADDVVAAAFWLVLVAATAIGLFSAFAWAIARSTTYTITNRRVVLRVGVAFPGSINLPFRRIKAAGLRRRRDGTGDIPLTLMADDSVPWVLLWPHVRPWRLRRAEPMLRSIPDADKVAALLARALSDDMATRTPVSDPDSPASPAASAA